MPNKRTPKALLVRSISPSYFAVLSGEAKRINRPVSYLLNVAIEQMVKSIHRADAKRQEREQFNKHFRAAADAPVEQKEKQ